MAMECTQGRMDHATHAVSTVLDGMPESVRGATKPGISARRCAERTFHSRQYWYQVVAMAWMKAKYFALQSNDASTRLLCVEAKFQWMVNAASPAPMMRVVMLVSSVSKMGGKWGQPPFSEL